MYKSDPFLPLFTPLLFLFGPTETKKEKNKKKKKKIKYATDGVTLKQSKICESQRIFSQPPQNKNYKIQFQ